MGRLAKAAVLCSLSVFAFACDDDPDDPAPLDASLDEGAGGQGGEGGAGGATDPDAGPDVGCLCNGQQTCDENGDCVEPAVCAGAEDCLPGRICVDSACLDTCADDGECGDGERCDPETAVCVEDDRCMTDDDCPGGACVEGACQAPCAEGECPGRQICDPDTGDCAEPDDCTDDLDCIDARICLDGACATPCGDNADCPGAQLCDEGQCIEPDVCAGDLDCTADRLCVAGACADPCGRAGCPGGLVCDPGSGRCDEADPCADDDGCFAGRICDGGVCVDPCAEDADCPGVLRCVEGQCVEPVDCEIDAACGAGRICVDGGCVDGCPAAPCPDDAECVEETGRCVVPGGCQEAADCAGAQRCVDGRCIEPSPCNGDFDCLDDRVCREGVCTTLCDRDAECPGSQVCDGERCIEGDGCDADRDCIGDRRCHPALGSCVETCPFGNCPPGQTCGDDGLCAESGACVDDTECVGDRVCRLGRCFDGGCDLSADCDAVCVDFSCAEAAPDTCDCPDGWACRDGSCEQPGPCGPCPDGWQCGDDGICQRCVEDGDCPGSALCSDGLCVDPPVCEADDDCLPGHICPFGRCEIDFAACDDDDIAGAGPDVATLLPPLALTGLRACDGQPDWFRVGDADDAVRVTVRVGDGPPPIVKLYDANNPIEPLAIASPQPGEARVSAGPGDYVVEVTAAPGASVAYGIEFEDDLDCAADAFERPFANDDADRARRIAPGTVRGTLCGNDEDWFEVDLARRLEIDIDGANADVDQQQAPAVVDGPAIIRVSGVAGSQYTLTVTPVADPVGACEDAERLGFGASTDATVEAGGDDFAPACRGPGGPERVFRLAVPRPGLVSARLEGLDPRGSLLLYSDCTAEPIACADAVGGIDAVVDAGEYYLVVDGPYAGDVRAELAADSPLCNAPEQLEPGATEIRMPLGPADIGGACTDPELGAVVRRISVDARSIARLSLAGGGPDALVSIRSDCRDDQPLGCGLAPAPEIAPRLEPGEYVAIIQGEGQLTATLNLEPADDLPGFADACDIAPLPVGPGSDVPLAGDLTMAGDTVDLAECGGFPASPDGVLRFSLEAPATVLAFVEEAAFGARLAIVDGGCGAVDACGDAMTGDVFTELDAGVYGLVMEADGLGGGPFRVRLQVR